jgi:hypothetical protein
VKKTLTISGHRRPDYFQRVLSALAFCEGVSEYAVTAVLDPSEWTDQLAEIARGHGITVHIPPQHLGCGATIRHCLALGFEASDYHIHLEDDTVPSPDALRWFEWAGRHASPMTLTISGYNQHAGDAEANTAGWRHWFTPWGWATWREHWEKYLLPGWDTSFWDGGVQRIRDNLGMGEMFPRVSRIQNIGATRGAFCPSEYFHRENQHATRVAGPEDKTERWIIT